MSIRRSRFYLVLPALLGFTLAVITGCQVRYRHEVEEAGTPANYDYSAGGFIRYDGYDDVAGDLEIASVDFKKPGSKITVRLTGVIHIGDLEYYRALQRECLDTADVVLFEGVKVEGQEEWSDEKKKEGGDLGKLYATMGNLLGIGFQKDGIDYTRANFVHCDVTLQADDPLNQQVDSGQLSQAMPMLEQLGMFKTMMAQGPEGKRMEDALKHQMVNVMAMQMGGETDEEMLKKIREKSSKDVPDAMRDRAEKAAEALKDLPIMPGMGMSPEMQEQILDRRNDHVLEQLKARLDAADPSKEQVIAVFYGAAHNPGLAAGLKSWGYELGETTWLRAWSMNSRGQGIVSERPTGKSGPDATRVKPRTPKKKDPVLYSEF